MNLSNVLAVAALSAAVSLTTSCAVVMPDAATMTKESQAATTPAQALQKLKDGNERFVSGHSRHRNYGKQVKATSGGQYPFASVVSCIDSRAAPEIVMDQGVGDIFDARVAGNIVNGDIIGSLEFASKVAGSKLIAVIGHTHCGAIKGACDHVELGNLTGLLHKIDPAVNATHTNKGEKRTSKNAAFVDHVAETNVRLTMANIRKQSPILRQMEKEGQLKIVGGMYDIETGKVTFMP